MLIVDVAEEGHVWDVIIELMVFREISRDLIVLTASLAVFLRRRVSILPQEDHGNDEYKGDSVEHADEPEHHVGSRFEEELAYLKVDDASYSRESDNEGHDDTSDHFGDTLYGISLHSHDDDEARTALEAR